MRTADGAAVGFCDWFGAADFLAVFASAASMERKGTAGGFAEEMGVDIVQC
ncbi:MAG: hypothetical protein LBT98_04410 [Puniceicoccales bacterium]|nr:hypothetical protein [Puniceicoccales bacterium]